MKIEEWQQAVDEELDDMEGWEEVEGGGGDIMLTLSPSSPSPSPSSPRPNATSSLSPSSPRGVNPPNAQFNLRINTTLPSATSLPSSTSSPTPFSPRALDIDNDIDALVDTYAFGEEDSEVEKLLLGIEPDGFVPRASEVLESLKLELIDTPSPSSPPPPPTSGRNFRSHTVEPYQTGYDDIDEILNGGGEARSGRVGGGAIEPNISAGDAEVRLLLLCFPPLVSVFLIFRCPCVARITGPTSSVF